MSVNVEYINPFVEATQSIFRDVCQENLEVGKIHLKVSPYTSNSIVIILGLTGQIKGQVIFSMETDLACGIASKMMMGMPVSELDEMAKSAISELTNMILGNTATIFYNKGISIDITPPALFIATNMQISSNKSQTICIPLVFGDGKNLEINVAIQENEQNKL